MMVSILALRCAQHVIRDACNAKRDLLKRPIKDTDWFSGFIERRGGGLGSRPKKMYGERLGDGVEYHLMSPTPRR